MNRNTSWSTNASWKTGKTCGSAVAPCLGRTARKGHQLDDHYFGTIPERVLAYMNDVERQLMEPWHPSDDQTQRSGPRPMKSPMFEHANVAVDHQMLTMHVLRTTALNHGFVLDAREAFRRGEWVGKHNNWAICTDTGVNLLDPQDETHTNMQFLVFCVR